MSVTKWWASIHRYFFIGVLFVVAIAIVVYIYPREGKFGYEYQKGKPWMHEVLIAPYDFPIYKSDAEVARAHDSIMVTFRPFYDYDSSMLSRELISFSSYYNELRLNRIGTEDELPVADYEQLKSFLSDILVNTYTKGIYEVDDYSEQLRSQDKSIILIKGAVAEEIPVSGLFTHKEAYEDIKERKDQILAEMNENIDLRMFEFISTISLYDFIKPNISYNKSLSDNELTGLLNNISLTRGLIQKGELIISRGELVNEYRFRVLESLRYEFGVKVGSYNSWLLILGQILLVSASFLILFLFLYNFRREVLDSFQKTMF
ncbi:MAG: hypothetical protein K8R35_06805, partial [Bacteroidales bacterium]|nr:hypothetical protein [Bacteroidales bacterium]